jgi:NADH dehydrogenase FAD-containing subunit
MTVAGGGAFGYDQLACAVGSGSADLRVPGAAEFAQPIASLEPASSCARSLPPPRVVQTAAGPAWAQVCGAPILELMGGGLAVSGASTTDRP